MRVGVYENKPKVFSDVHGQPSGFFIDILRYVAAQERWTLDYVSCQWEACLDAVERGDLDLMVDVAYSEERDRRFDFNQEVVLSNWSIVYEAQRGSIHSVLDLDGKTIAVVEGSIQHDELLADSQAFNIQPDLVEVASFDQIMTLLDTGQVDGGVVNRFYGLQFEDQYTVYRTNVLIQPVELYYVTAEGENPELLAAIDRYLTNLKDQPDSIYYEASDRWLEPLTGDRLNWLAIRTAMTGLSLALLAIITVNVLVWNRRLTREIAERKHAETSLSNSERRYRQVVQAQSDLILRSLPDTTITFANNALCQVLGLPIDQLLGLRWDRLVPADDLEILHAKIASLSPESPVFENINRDYRADGDVGWTQWINQGIFDDRGNLVEIQSVGRDITELRNAELAIQQNEAFLQDVTRSIPGAIIRYVLHPDGSDEVAYMSPGCLELWEVEAHQVEQKPYLLWDAIHPDDVPGMRASIIESAQTLTPWTHEWRIIAPVTRQQKWVQAVGQPKRLDNGDVLWTTVLLDVTARKQAELALQKSEEQLRLALDVTHIGAWDWQLSNDQVEWNDNHFRLLGYRPGDVESGYPQWRDRVHPDDVDRVEGAIAHAMATQTGFTEEYRIVHPDGNVHWLLGTGRMVRDPQGHANRMIGVILDITERKQAEAALRESEARWQFALDGSGDGVWDWDAETNTVFYSHQWKAMLGYTDDEIGNSLDEWDSRLHPEDKERCYADLNRHFNGETPLYQNEHRLRCKDGSYKWILDRGNVIERAADGSPKRVIGTHTDIDDRKQAETERLHAEKLRLELKLIEQLFDTVLAGYWDWDIPNKREYYSPGFKRMFGYEDHELPNVPGTWERLILPEDRPKAVDCYKRHVETQGAIPYYNEVRYRHKNGSIIWVICSGQVIEWGDENQPRRMVGFHLDISDRKRAEQALATSETRLKTLVNALPFGVWVRDENDILVLQNAVDIAHYGSILGTKLDDLKIAPEHIAKYRELKERCHPGEVLSRESTERVAGEERTFLRIETPLPDGISGGVGMLGVAIDVTELKRAREALQLSEERLRALINALPFGIWVRDAKGRLILQNKEDIARFGDIIGTDLSDESVPSDWAAIYAEMQQRCRIEGVVQYERCEIINDEERTFIHIDAPLPELDGGMGLFGVSIDITDRKRAEEQIQRYADQLEATNQELESFTYSVSHDLRAPLRHIGGFINALRLRLQNTPAMDDAKVTHYLNVIEGSSHKMGALIEGLLTLSRVGRRDMQLLPVNLQELIHQVVQDVQGKVPDQDSRQQPMYGDAASSPDRPEFTIHPLPTVKGDAVLLRQVFYNLIENALKFSGDRHPPRIEIGTAEFPPDSPYRNGSQTLFIKDNGVGFDMKYADQLFGAFQRLHSEREFSGMGIGLAIVHRIIHRHGGKIWAESYPGEGACFYIRFVKL